VENSNIQKRKRKKTHRSVLLTSNFYINEVKEKAAEKKKKELIKFGRYVRKRLQLDSENMFQEKLFDEREEYCPCLYCNELFFSSKPGESWLRCVKCKLWAHCECAGVKKRAKMFICD
jgi:hypothetical protein